MRSGNVHIRRSQRSIAPLDLKGKLGSPFAFESAKTVSTGGKPLGPVVVELDPTSYCDLACPNCITSDVLNQDRFPTSALMQLPRQFADVGVQAVILIGGGEPLLHSATPSLIAQLAELGIRIGVVTNGTRMAKHTALLAHATEWVRVSLDAGSRRTYGLVRPARSGQNMFDIVTSSIEELAKAGKTNVGLSFVVQNGAGGYRNLGEIALAARLARDLGCTYIEFKAEMNEDHSLVELGESDHRELVDQIEGAQCLETRDFSVELNAGVKALARGHDHNQPKAYSSCPVSLLRTLVAPSGCFVCAYHRGNPSFKYGDIEASDFGAAWNQLSPALIDPSRDCNFFCARHDSNLALLDGSIEATDLRDPFI